MAFLFWLFLHFAWSQSFDGYEVGKAQYHLEQARLFSRKGWLNDAQKELILASKDPDGSIHPQVWLMLTEVSFELFDIEQARYAAGKAHTYSRGDQDLQQALYWSQVLEQFGQVQLEISKEESISIQLESLLLDPTLKNYLSRLQEHLKTHFSSRLDLPKGTYQINGQSVTVEPKSQLTVSIPATHTP